ncbi:response regulator [Deinococcus malanensis]|uniref:Response regulator n=1 Tax=Deinococcus malanensis TaxID=1706855 RepID=A0ABQ2EZZ0_9DEIO|nr:response regulator [Deinococcus malanensis]GGK36023.1 response regulator [Deinococcus malanensis]
MFDVLMVEDNPSDVVLMELALENFLPELRLTVVPDGAEALAYLKQQHPYSGAFRPHLVLLDGNTPRMGAIEVLQEVRRMATFADLPIVVFSGSIAAEDAKRSIAAGADQYVAKPGSFGDYTRVVQQLLAFWYGKAGTGEIAS